MECSCHCESCVYECNGSKNGDSVVVQLYQEIENLKRQVAERDYHIVQMETSVMDHAKEYPNGEFQALQETLRFWQEKYDRLSESHRKLQKVNQGLEDKLLRIVDKFESEKTTLTQDIADLTSKLVEARVTINEIEEENEHYKNDCTLAANLLQCKPSNFVSYKVNSLPADLQERIRNNYANNSLGKRRSLSIGSGISNSINKPHRESESKTGNGKTIRVPISTFPPTAMVYSVNKVDEETKESGGNQSNGPDHVSAAIIAKILEERSKERLLKSGSRYQKCHQCRQRCIISPYYDASTQTSNSIVTPDDCITYPYDSDYCDSLVGSNGSYTGISSGGIISSHSSDLRSESFSTSSMSSSHHNGSSPIGISDQSANKSNNHYSPSSAFNNISSNNGLVSSTKVKSSYKSYSNETMII